MLDIPFNQIPSALRLPGAFIEIDASRAGRSFDPGRCLLIGQASAIALPAVANTPLPIGSKNDADAAFGAGSILSNMVAAWRAADPFGLINCLPIADAGGGVAATGTITVTAAATGPGSIPIYVGDTKVLVAVAGTETINQTATAIAAAINANPDLPVTAAAVNAVVTLTARNKGTLGNDIQLALAYLGAPAGEVLPPTFAAAIVAMGGAVAGVNDPDITAALANLGDTTYDYIVMAFTDATNMTAAANFMNAATEGRWAYDKMLWGHVFTVKRATYANLVTYGLGRNDPHISVLGVYQTQTTIWKWIAAAVGVSAIALRNDPARPVQGIQIPGVMAPPIGSAGLFTKTERQALLWSGISTYTVDQYGNCYVERLISTYQLNQNDIPDDAWLSVEKNFTLMAVNRRLRANLLADFPRYKLAADGTRIAPGAAVTTPGKLRGWLVAQLRIMEERDGWLQNVDAFKDQVLVQINGNNPDRVDMLFPPSLIGQLRTFAVLNQFHIYPTP
jgi:phage tail sheath gpL-like